MAIPDATQARIERVNEALAQLNMVDIPDVLEGEPTLPELRILGDLALSLHAHSSRITATVLDALELYPQRVARAKFTVIG